MKLSARARTLLSTSLVAAVATGIAILGLHSLPDVTRTRLPGAAGGSDTYTVTAEFTDALDLVPNSTVRVADVAVGRVTDVQVKQGTKNYLAVATLEIDDSVSLPADTVASISSTSLLGEKYVALIAPKGGDGSLEDAGTIGLARTSQDVEVEQILSSVGAVLNGGGLQQLSSITREMSTALSGNEDDTRQLLGNLDAIVSRLAAGRPALVDALHNTARLSRALAHQNTVLARGVEALDPATGVLADQIDELREALQSLDRLSDKATSLIEQSTDDTVANLAALDPVLEQLGQVADQVPALITNLSTYPLPDNAVRSFSSVYGAIRGPIVVDIEQLLALVAPTAPTPRPDQVAPTDEPLLPLPDLGPLTDPLGVPDVVGGLTDLLTPRAEVSAP
jgi:phospholipid/cholesterol/gamma-HCH transport system substrate-binding protein